MQVVCGGLSMTCMSIGMSVVRREERIFVKEFVNLILSL
jgi:hypothetical protein